MLDLLQEQKHKQNAFVKYIYPIERPGNSQDMHVANSAQE